MSSVALFETDTRCATKRFTFDAEGCRPAVGALWNCMQLLLHRLWSSLIAGCIAMVVSSAALLQKKGVQ